VISYSGPGFGFAEKLAYLRKWQLSEGAQSEYLLVGFLQVVEYLVQLPGVIRVDER